MEQVRTDPRLTRTRQLIVDSFVLLSNRKEFSSITVKDITEEAHINRATFYNHFLDKYDLLEKVVSEKLKLNLGCDQAKESLPLDSAIKELFLALTRFDKKIDPYCSSQEETETIDTIVNVHLNAIFSERLMKLKQDFEPEMITKLSALMTHSIIGMSKDYRLNESDESPEDYIDSMLPYLLCGIEN